MAEKILNTRILMKVDTLENWNNSTLALKKGELAFATVAATAGNGLTEPVVMVKIGEDGVKTFKDLSWNFYAKASDVIAEAKSADTLETFVKNVIANSGIASDDAMEALADRVTAVENDLNTADTGLKARMTAAESAIAALDELVGDDKVSDAIANAIAALDLDNTYDAKGDAAQALTDAKAYADGLNTAMDTRVKVAEGKAHEHANKEELDKIVEGDKAKWDAMEQNAKDYADGLDKAMDARVDALEAKFGDGEGNVESQIAAAVAAEKAEREAADTALQNQIGTASVEGGAAATGLHARIEDLEDLVGDTKVSTQISDAVAVEKARAEAAEKVNADAIAVLNGNTSVEGSVDKKVADAINEFATQMSDDNTVNTYKELINYAATHGAEFTELVGEVDANTQAIATLNGDATTAGSVDKKIADAIAASLGETGNVATAIEAAVTEANGYTDAEVEKLADGAVATNTAAIDALEALVGDTAVATQITNAIDEALKIDGVDKYALASALTAAIEQHNTDKATLEAAINLKANDADLAAIAKTGNVNDLVQAEGDVLVFDCGGAGV